MRTCSRLLMILILACWVPSTAAQAKKQPALSTKILSAKSVYFDDQTRAPKVGEKALAQLKKWGRFQIVQDRTQADLIILLSADPYKGGYIVKSGGQTGTVDRNGQIDEDPVPNYNKAAPVRFAYLTVIESKTGDKLWSDSHHWGGLLTGFNSVGERLIKKFQAQTLK